MRRTTMRALAIFTTLVLLILAPRAQAIDLVTTYAGGSGQNGNFFDLVALDDVLIQGFDINSMEPAGATVWAEIYTMAGTCYGDTQNPGAWTLVGSTAVLSEGSGVPTPLDIVVDVSIAAGQTQGFYVTTTDNTFLNYTPGTALGMVFVQDAKLQITEGYGAVYPFLDNFNPRVWNGTIHYCTGADVDGDGHDDCTDCNDNDAGVFPGATETCDGVDEDCDGDIDEDFDVDQDGFTTCNGDCDDTNAGINPDAFDIPLNGIDEDCDGLVDPCEYTEKVALGPGLNLLITDGGSDGTLATMDCTVLPFQDWGDGADTVLGNMTLTVGMTQTWINDLWFKLVSPTGTVLTVMAAPLNNNHLSMMAPINFWDGAPFDAADVGSVGLVVCQDDGMCDFFPNPNGDPESDISTFAGFNGENAIGNWQFCVGDTFPADPPLLDYVSLSFDRAEPSPGSYMSYYLDNDHDGYGADGTEIQACNPPANWVGLAGDCDDTQGTTYPGADEDPVTAGEPDTVDNNCDGVADDGLVYPGDLLITEVMNNPETPPTDDADGEWFEVFNTTLFDLSLEGLWIEDLDTDSTQVVGTVIIPAGDYAVLARNGDDAVNGGLVDDYDYDGFTLANGDDEILLYHGDPGAGAPLLDEIWYDGGPLWPDLNGISMNLDFGSYGENNNDGFFWCEGAGDYGPTNDEGTPGADNVYCCWDDDGDGYDEFGSLGCPGGSDIDCNDSDPAANPGMDEYCNGFDDDCDGFTDEPDALDAPDWCDDTDGDGYGDPASCVTQCNAPGGTVANSLDCDDSSAAINPDATEICDEIDNNCDGQIDEGLPNWTWWPDADGDGYGEIGGPSFTSCLVPSGYADNETDCDDTDAAINPGATEVCDGADNDCDGTVDVGATDATDWYADADGDTYGDPGDTVTECVAPSGYVADGTDCDDADSAVHPGATEICNGIDDDCDGLVDDGLTFVDYYPDADGDTYGDMNAAAVSDCAPLAGHVTDHTDCDDSDAAIHPGAAEVCNGLDDDCDGTADDGLTFVDYYPDADGDTYGDDSAAATSACNPISGYVTDNTDCDDAVAAVNPGAAEVCDGVDNDCDGFIDVGAIDALTWYEDFDGDGYGDAASTTDACDQPTGYVADDTDCDDTAAAVNPGMPEICNAGVDDDCDAATDETVDDDGDGLSECEGDCDDGDADVHPSAIEVCDGIDNDCNPNTDEDVDDDGDGETECEGDCNDNNDQVFSTAAEVCDGLDNDCDGNLGVDEIDADGDGSFLCDVPPDCDDSNNLTYPGAPEQCDGLDNDCDDEIDEDVGVDQDGDGFNACQGDCDDNDANVYPGAPVELCDGKDTDCDGFIPPIEVDMDFDGYLACEECDDNNAALNNDDLDADGASTCDGDCDDTDPNLNIADVDMDGDTTCDGDCDDNDATLNLADDDLDGYSSCTGDCDDNDGTVNPDATEVCDNGVDNDCDGVADDVDADQDGYIDEACGGQDCDDNDGAINPDADEDCGDGIDNDCDGDVDEDDDECTGDDDTGDDDTGDDDTGDDDTGDDDTGSDDDATDDDTDDGTGDCECNADAARSPVAPIAALLALLGLVIIRRRQI